MSSVTTVSSFTSHHGRFSTWRSTSTSACSAILLMTIMIAALPNAATATSSSSSCTLCVDGHDMVVNRTRSFPFIPRVLMKNCGELVDVAQLIDAGSNECTSVQTWGTYCGCSVPANACTICQPGLIPFILESPLRQLKPSEFNIFGATSFTVLTCEAYNSALNVLATEGDPYCAYARNLNNGLQKCACATPNTTQVGVVDDMPPFFDPNATMSPTPAPISVCTVCPQGNDASLVNVTKDFNVPGLLVKTCGDLVEAASLFQEASPECQSIRTLASFCECPAPADACGICPPGEISFFPTAPLRQINVSEFPIFGVTPETIVTCEILDSALHLLAVEGDSLCQEARLLNNGLQKCACALPNATSVSVTDDQPTFITMTPVAATVTTPGSPVAYSPTVVQAASPAPAPVNTYGGDSSSGQSTSGTEYGGDSKSGKGGKRGSAGKAKGDNGGSPKNEKEGGAKSSKTEKAGGKE